MQKGIVTLFQVPALLAGGKCVCLLLARCPGGISAQRGDVTGGTHTFCAGAATPVVSGRLAACRAPGSRQPDATASLETAREEQHLAWAERGLPEEGNLQALLWRQYCLGFSFLGPELMSLQCSCWKWRAGGNSDARGKPVSQHLLMMRCFSQVPELISCALVSCLL